MTSLDSKDLYNLVIASCAQALRSEGYVRRGSSLRKQVGDNVAIIDFQKSNKSSADVILFTVNLGVVCGQLLEAENGSLRKVGVVDAHVRQRIGMLLPDRPDKWWTIDRETDAKSLLEVVSCLIELEAAPYLDRYLSDKALVALWESGQSPGLTESQRLKCLIKIKIGKEIAV